MMITVDILEKKWASVTYYDGGFIRIEASHPLEWYVGYQSIDQKTMLIVTDYEMPAPLSSKSVIVTRRRRETDGKWTLTFELMYNEQEGVFINLCCDILNYSQSASGEMEALKLVIMRYKQWSRLLEYQKTIFLDENRKKGLMGELIFLQTKLQEGIAFISAVQAWVGPDGADQDFAFSNGWYEIKALGVSADSVSISSLQQLDNDQLGELIIVRIDKCAPERQGSFSITQKVAEIREIIRQDSDAAALFELKLEKYGYIDMPEYETQKYYYTEKKSYKVDGTFPKLSSKNVPHQVIAGQYILSIAGIGEWEI
jgi:hypothetical protein